MTICRFEAVRPVVHYSLDNGLDRIIQWDATPRPGMCGRKYASVVEKKTTIVIELPVGLARVQRKFVYRSPEFGFTVNTTSSPDTQIPSSPR